MNFKPEGYWYNERLNPDYPMPKPNQLTNEQAVEIYDLIIEKQNECEKVKYRGLSRSRITGEILGCAEFRHLDGWLWPCDFPTHYVRDHKVKPSDEFLNWLGYKNN